MTHPVPLLDLAPKRKTPLSLWNPLDYLVIFSWVCFFPQAINWYVEKFGTVSYEERNFRSFIQMLRNDHLQRNLFIQGILLAPLASTGGLLLLQTLGIHINWFWVGFGIGAGIWAGVMFGLASGIGFGITFSVVFGTILGLVSGVAGATADIIGFGISGIVAGAVVATIVFGVALGLPNVVAGVEFGVTLGLAFSIVFGMLIGIQFTIVSGALFILLFVLGFSIGAIVSALRLPDFLFFWLPFTLPNRRTRQLYPLIAKHTITWISPPGLVDWLLDGLHSDPVTMLHNIDQLLRYSMQFTPIVKTINVWLENLPKNEIYERVNMLARAPYNWTIVRFGSASLDAAIGKAAIQGITILPKAWELKFVSLWNDSLRIDTPAHAACAGYWLMHTKDTFAAMKAFARNRHIPHGETLYQTARALDLGLKTKTLQDVVAWETETNWLDVLDEEPLRPQAIAILKHLRSVTREASVAAISYSKLNRSTALGRALAALTELVDNLKITCPELERPMVNAIGFMWTHILAREAGKVGQAAIIKPVENPFVVGNPVSGAVFVGREEILGRIEELWSNNTQGVPSLVIFGHRRMGKSSILQNLGERRFGVNTIVAQFTMQRAGRLQNTGELLGIFASCMHEALSAKGINVPEPDFAIFERSPYQSFNSFLAAVKRQINGQRVILTIDEFELIEDAIQKKAVDAELLSYLRGVIHSEHWFVLALAGLHTLEEMTADYWNPLFSSVTPVRVSFLSWEATANLLANPTDDFPLDFTREAIDCVYAHVKGQPFLTQLIGHTLVRLYNQSVFENLNPREPRFSAADVDEVVGRPEFYEQGHYYFQGVWSQAQSGPQGQLALLRALAQADGALPLEECQSAAGTDASLAEAAVKTLLQHDVVWLTPEGDYDFAVPLMRRWLRKNRE